MGIRFLLTLLFIASAGCTAARTDSAIAAGDPAGSHIFSQYCAGCHGQGGEGTSAAPSLKAMKDRQTVTQVVTNGLGNMPSFGNKLSQEQIAAVAGYITGQIAQVSLQGGDLSKGGVLYRVN